MNIRNVTKDDVTQLIPLFDAYRVFYKQESNPTAVGVFLGERLAKKDSEFFVAETENTLVGFTQLYPTFSSVSLKRFYILNDIYVDPKFRSKGVGKALLSRAQEFAKDNNLKGLSLQTAVDNPAQHLYEHMGWKLDVENYFYFWMNE